ncbi:TRL domain-containing protein [Leptospira sp. 96542]|nr:TRL domain-containing protein [Leptospira sp. 96542]
MKKFYLIISVFSIFLINNCVSSPFPSAVFLNTTQHVMGDTKGLVLTSAKIQKSGKSCSMSGFLTNIFYYGNGNSIEDAMKNGEITKISLIDRNSLSILGFLFYRECIVVWGE